jgi:drug/metabolite transporter (DMT)-like permease
VTALLCGVLTALMWTSSNLCSARAVRYVPQYSVVAWITLVGLLITLPFCLAGGIPAGLDAARALGLGVAGLAVVGGLLLLYGAFRIGKVSVVAPVAATEGAVAAVISAAAGESLAPAAAVVLVVIVIGVGLSVVAPDPQPVPDERPVRAAMMATGAACSFGLGLYLTGRWSHDLPLAWILMLPRLVGTVALMSPLLITRRLRLARPAVPLVVATGFSEVLGYLAFTLGAADSIATVSVMASQVATFTALGGWLLFGERLGRVQVLGIAVLISAVTGLAVLSSG